MLATPDRVLSVIVDVSCDTSNPHNPLPFCNISTTFDKPTYVVPAGASGVACVTIDHLPTLLPLESSQHFARDLLPTLMLLKTVSLVFLRSSFLDLVFSSSLRLFGLSRPFWRLVEASV